MVIPVVVVVCRIGFSNSSWNSIFFDPMCMVSTLGGLLLIDFVFSISNYYGMTSNVDVVDSSYVCDDIWPVGWHVVNFGLHYIVGIPSLLSSETWFSCHIALY